MQTRLCRRCGVEKAATTKFFEPAGPGENTTLRRVCRACRCQEEQARYYVKKYGHLPGGESAHQMRKDTPVCQICGASSALCIDHSHGKQYVRGVICNNCNLGLGHFKDSPETLEAAIEYIIASDSHHDKREKS